MSVSRIAVPVLLAAALASHAGAASLDANGVGPLDLMQPQPRAGIIVEVGFGVNSEPAYEGAADYTTTISPIIEIERLTIPGLVDKREPSLGLTVSPAMDFIAERNSADHAWLVGLADVEATYAPGVRVGYEAGLAHGVRGEVFGKLQYALGGATGLLGSVGTSLSWRLAPQLTVTGGAAVSFAGDDYMSTYFGVTQVESGNTGGRLAPYDPKGGAKSASINLSAKYEFVQDTFLTLKGSYSQLLGSASDSPIVEKDGQFIVSAGLTRKFTLGY